MLRNFQREKTCFRSRTEHANCFGFGPIRIYNTEKKKTQGEKVRDKNTESNGPLMNKICSAPNGGNNWRNGGLE